MFDFSLLVKTGDELTAELWDKLQKAGRATRILFGNGIRGRRTPDGTLLSCSLWSPWPHPFKVNLSGDGATIARGLINTVEPTIKKVPISGTEKLAAPVLDMKKPKLDADGRGWIAIEATFEKAKYKLESAEIVQVDSLESKERLKHLHPLALLRRRSNGSLELFQLEMFNVTLYAYPNGAKPIRYFPVPA